MSSLNLLLPVSCLTLVLVTVINAETDDSIFQCRYIHNLFVEQGGDHCSPYDCWNSQLLDLSRDSLIKIFNDYKASIAQKKCERCAYPGDHNFGPVFQKHYYWGLELAAMHYQRVHNETCAFKGKASITKDDFPDDVDDSELSRRHFQEFEHRDMEYAATSFKVDTHDDQTCALERFKLLMQTDQKHNLFDAWDEMKYRYAQVTEFGCTLTIRNNVTGTTAVNETVSRARVAFLACVFAFQRTDNDIDNPENCTQHQAEIDNRTKLCYYPRIRENAGNNIPCQFYYNISNGTLFPRCRDEVPRVWSKNEAPNPRHRQIHIKISNSDVIELDVATGSTSIKSVRRESDEKNSKAIAKVSRPTSNYAFGDSYGGEDRNEETNSLLEYEEMSIHRVEPSTSTKSKVEWPKIPLTKPTRVTKPAPTMSARKTATNRVEPRSNSSVNIALVRTEETAANQTESPDTDFREDVASESPNTDIRENVAPESPNTDTRGNAASSFQLSRTRLVHFIEGLISLVVARLIT